MGFNFCLPIFILTYQIGNGFQRPFVPIFVLTHLHSVPSNEGSLSDVGLLSRPHRPRSRPSPPPPSHIGPYVTLCDLLCSWCGTDGPPFTRSRPRSLCTLQGSTSRGPRRGTLTRLNIRQYLKTSMSAATLIRGGGAGGLRGL